MAIQDIKIQIVQNGTKLAQQILNNSQIIRKYSQPHFREGMVCFFNTLRFCLETSSSFIIERCIGRFGVALITRPQRADYRD